MKLSGIKVIGFDADDTLWVNEPYYKEFEQDFCQLMEPYIPNEQALEELFQTEIKNLEWYGYGAKGFALSLIETAIRISNGNVPVQSLDLIIKKIKELLGRNIELLEGVTEVLPMLKEKYLLIIATKGDLLDQERKLKKSGLLPFFHHIEIMSDKKESDYLGLITKMEILPEEFLMVGNSLKSDIFPVLSIHGKAVYIPYHTSWQFETTDNEKGFTYQTIERLNELPSLLK